MATYGYTGPFNGGTGAYDEQAWFQQALTIPTTMSVSSLSYYGSQYACSVYGRIWNSSGTKIYEGAANTDSGSTAWRTSTFSPSNKPLLVAGNTYYFGVYVGTSLLGLTLSKYETGGVSGGKAGSYSATNTITPPGAFEWQLGFYLTYEEVTGPADVNTINGVSAGNIGSIDTIDYVDIAKINTVS